MNESELYDREETRGETRALLAEPEPWDDEFWDFGPVCVACTGPLVELGQLGSRLHFRCRSCGLDQSIVIPFPPEEES